jgi:hypothetical protein
MSIYWESVKRERAGIVALRLPFLTRLQGTILADAGDTGTWRNQGHFRPLVLLPAELSAHDIYTNE